MRLKFQIILLQHFPMMGTTEGDKDSEKEKGRQE